MELSTTPTCFCHSWLFPDCTLKAFTLIIKDIRGWKLYLQLRNDWQMIDIQPYRSLPWNWLILFILSEEIKVLQWLWFEVFVIYLVIPGYGPNSYILKQLMLLYIPRQILEGNIYILRGGCRSAKQIQPPFSWSVPRGTIQLKKCVLVARNGGWQQTWRMCWNCSGN